MPPAANGTVRYSRDGSQRSRSSSRSMSRLRGKLTPEGYFSVLTGRCYIEPVLSRHYPVRRSHSQPETSRRRAQSEVNTASPVSRTQLASASPWSQSQLEAARRWSHSPLEECKYHNRCSISEHGMAFYKRRSSVGSIHSLSTVTDLDPSMAFGEIAYLKNKLGFTLPSAEDTLKAVTLRYKPRGRLYTLADHMKRYNKHVDEAKLMYVSSQMSTSSLDYDRKRRLVGYVPQFGFKLDTQGQTDEGRCSLTDRDILRRHKTMSELNLLVKNLESEALGTKKPRPPSRASLLTNQERALVVLGNGRMISYTTRQLEALREADEEMLKLVKQRITSDRKKLALFTRKKLDKALKRISASITSTTTYSDLLDMRRRYSKVVPQHLFRI